MTRKPPYCADIEDDLVRFFFDWNSASKNKACGFFASDETVCSPSTLARSQVNAWGIDIDQAKVVTSSPWLLTRLLSFQNVIVFLTRRKVRRKQLWNSLYSSQAVRIPVFLLTDLTWSITCCLYTLPHYAQYIRAYSR